MFKKKLQAAAATLGVLIGILLTAVVFYYSIFSVLVLPAAAAAEDKNQSVYLGGTPVGIVQNADGAVITQLVEVETTSGKNSPVGIAGGKVGDVITKINGKEVRHSADIKAAVDAAVDTVVLTINRNKNIMEIAVRPAVDMVLKEKKLGILMKDNLAGVGTLTYISKDLSYGALGHRIQDGIAGDPSVYRTGDLFQCRIIGYKKGEIGQAGELKGSFHRSEKPVGCIDKNLFCGVFGKFSNGDAIVGRELTAVGHQNEVVQGNAKIYTTIDGKTPKYYDIQIVKTNKQAEAKEKSMVIRVTDPVLLKATGGIVQGMSGSPILQNGKLIGAVTHVFVNDPTSGYGIYADWMLQN